MRNVIGVILGGGKGTRLFPLTQHRSKPAVPLAGKYRLIDIPISNCLNSGVNRIYVLTQFNSVSLHRHIRQTYIFDHFSGGFVGILAAQQTLEGTDWYQGTADAVRKQLRYIEQPGIDYVLVLSGDQLYRMDYAEMLQAHRRSGAEVSIAAVPVTSEQAAAFGIMRIDETGRVVDFLEKPKTEEQLSQIRSDPAWLDASGIDSRGRDCLASTGIYVFNRDTLVDLLRQTDYEDFGREVFPHSIRTGHVQMFPFDGYWEDIGTIGAFYQANLDLARCQPPFDFVSQKQPIYTHPRFLPPTRMDGATVQQSLIADGCTIGRGAVIENSVVGIRCGIGENVTIRNSVIMGMDQYPLQEDNASGSPNDYPRIGIGDGCLIDGAIIDKNCRIGPGVQLQKTARMPQEAADWEAHGVVIRDGLIVAKKGAVLPEGWSLEAQGG